MELYNYILFAAMIPVISSIFFPHNSIYISTAFAYASFAITFLIAPLGAFYWGKIGDKYGPEKIVQYSSLMMAIPSILIAFLPSFEQIGIVAPISIIFLRIVQGFSASGEVQGSKILAMSNVPDYHFGKVSGFISACGALGVMLAFYSTKLSISTPEAWRYCFAMGGTLVLVSRAIKYAFQEKRRHILSDQKSAFEVLLNDRDKALFVFLIGGVLGILSYTLHAFLNPYIFSFGFHSQNTLMGMSLMALFCTALSAVICGIIIDSIEKKSLPIFLFLIIISVLVVTPLCWQMFTSSLLSKVAMAYSIFGINLGFYACCSGVAIYKVFPKSKVCRGLLPSNAAGVAFFGGLSPFMMHLLSGINHYLPIILIYTVCISAGLYIIRFNKSAKLTVQSEI